MIYMLSLEMLSRILLKSNSCDPNHYYKPYTFLPSRGNGCWENPFFLRFLDMDLRRRNTLHSLAFTIGFSLICPWFFLSHWKILHLEIMYVVSYLGVASDFVWDFLHTFVWFFSPFDSCIIFFSIFSGFSSFPSKVGPTPHGVGPHKKTKTHDHQRHYNKFNFDQISFNVDFFLLSLGKKLKNIYGFWRFELISLLNKPNLT